jgi:competence protein ComEC
LLGPFANALAIPWISFAVVPLALLGCLCAPWPAISGPIWQLSALLMECLYRLLQWAAQSPWAALDFPEPGLIAVLAALLGALLLLLPSAVQGKWLGLLLMLPMLRPMAPDMAHGQLSIAMIDVGQGLSILVKTRRPSCRLCVRPARVSSICW